MKYVNARKKVLLPAVLVASLLATPLAAFAQETGNFQGRAGKMADQLNPDLQNFDRYKGTGPRLKNIVVTGKDHKTYGVVADMWRKLVLSLHFAPGSDVLPRKAKKLLQDVGGALEELNGSNRKFLVIGHTDATGDAAGNRRLSLRRARAVRTYITSHFNIKPSRLLVAGLGESVPLDQKNPASVRNRRVEIALVERDSAGYGRTVSRNVTRAGGEAVSAVCNSYRGPELKDIRPQHLGLDDYDARTPVPCDVITGHIKKHRK